MAAGLGYIEFAIAHPALFRLMFASERPDFADPALRAASRAAYAHLLEGIGALRGRDPVGDPAGMTDARRPGRPCTASPTCCRRAGSASCRRSPRPSARR